MRQGGSSIGVDGRQRSAAELAGLSRDPVSVEVSKRLLSHLMAGNVLPGERLPSERDLATALGVPRNAVRDGLRPLVMLGLLESRTGSGTYLKASTSDLLPEIVEWGLLLGEPNVAHLVEARLFVEIGLARLSAQRRDDAALATLRDALARMRSSQRTQQFRAADLQFHLGIAEAAGNPPLAGVLRSIRGLLEVWIRRVVSADVDLRRLHDEHAAILAPIEDGDEAAAGAAMERHLRAVTARLLEGIESERSNNDSAPSHLR